MAMSSPIRMSQQRPIDKEFEDADDNGVLNLSGRNLRMFPNVPGELCDFADVFEADFSKNRLDRIPDEVCNFRALVKLNCYHNSIRFVPYELSDLMNLQELDLSRNFLQQIPPELCKMNLTSLNLSNNRLVSLPLELGKLALLRHLDLSCNLLPDLPNSICQLSSLQHLDLHRNELKDIPADICVLPLMYLDISSNFLCRLPTTLRLIVSLYTLRVADNPLESPPTQVCVRGLVHISKYLESLEKRGSDPHLLSLSARDETLRRRKEHSNKKSQSARPMSESTPLHNGRDHPLDFYHEMVSLVNTTIGDDPAIFKDQGEMTPTGAKHWSVAQFMTPDKVTASHHDSSHAQTPPSHKELHNPPRMTDQSKEEYREAAHRLYMEQERQKRKLQKFRSSSPPPSSTSYTTPHSTQSSSHFGTLPKSEGSKGEGRVREGMRPKVVGRSLPNERYPRSGSWNSHMRISSPALPSKYSTPPPERARSDPDEERGVEEMGGEERQRTKQATREAVRDFVIKRASHSATDLRSTSTEVPPQPPPKKRPPPLNTAQPSTPTDHHQTPRDDAVSPASSREGSITPTNEPPPMEEPLEEPMTPKDSNKRLSYSMDDLLEMGERGGEGGGRRVTFSSTDNLVISPSPDHDMKQSSPPPQQEQQQPEKWGAQVERHKERSVSATDSTVVIEDLENSPSQKKRPLSAGDTESPFPADSTWPNLKSPHRKKNKDVFRFLSKQSDTNYTVRRHQLQMSRILEKNQHVKKSIESMMGVQLSDDIGDWIMDGVLVCQVVNKLHPGTINTIHTTTEGQPLPLSKRTMNIAAFIAACRKLNIPEEELCSAGDIMELKDPLRVITCLQRVLETAQ